MGKRKGGVSLAKKEFTEIITTYVLPLFDTKEELMECKLPVKYHNYCQHIIVPKKSCYTYFKPIRERGEPAFCYRIKAKTIPRVIRFLEVALRELLDVCEVSCYPPHQIKRYYGDDETYFRSYKDKCLNLAFELGMCNYLCGGRNKRSVIFHSLICKMIEWSERTYEGKNVSFGIVIDFDKESDGLAADYLKFLDNDASAVFTDGIFTGVLLDANGKIDSFITRNTSSDTYNDKKTLFLPFKFWDIAKHCRQNAIGIIALENGEILLIKDYSIVFAKRGSRWVFYDWTIVYNALRPYFINSMPEEEVEVCIKKIYCSVLDVAFSHTGGCISVILPKRNVMMERIITERLDNIDEIQPTSNNYSNDDVKRQNKRQTIKSILSDSKHILRSFYEIDQQLRKEMISLDGATAFNVYGTLYGVGSIVSVDGGSSGGGRTAAAKQLARLGIGIKISEDGYVEAWGMRPDCNDINNNEIISLFTFK